MGAGTPEERRAVLLAWCQRADEALLYGVEPAGGEAPEAMTMTAGEVAQRLALMQRELGAAFPRRLRAMAEDPQTRRAG